MDSASTHALFGAAFRQGLRDSGYTEGQNATILWRFAANNASLLPGLMSEMMSQKVDLLVADTTQAALAAQHATRSIPIVVPTSGDLLGVGLVETLAKPQEISHGLTLMSGGLIGKRLALLREMAPRTTRVAVLMNPDNPAGAFQLKEAQTAVEVTAPTVIALTGYGQAEDRKRTKEAGFDHHLIKPSSAGRSDGHSRVAGEQPTRPIWVDENSERLLSAARL